MNSRGCPSLSPLPSASNSRSAGFAVEDGVGVGDEVGLLKRERKVSNWLRRRSKGDDWIGGVVDGIVSCAPNVSAPVTCEVWGARSLSLEHSAKSLSCDYWHETKEDSSLISKFRDSLDSRRIESTQLLECGSNFKLQSVQDLAKRVR